MGPEFEERAAENRDDGSFDWEARMREVAWGEYATAYGPATDVPAQLERLRSGDAKTAMDASHDLWCGLCHQHVQIGSAALPALPFLLTVYRTAGEALQAEILDILLGLALCSNPRRLTDDARAMRQEVAIWPWVMEVRRQLTAEAPWLIGTRNHANEEIAGFAQGIVDELADGQPQIAEMAAQFRVLPEFDEKVERFQRFLAADDWPVSVRWVGDDDLVEPSSGRPGTRWLIRGGEGVKGLREARTKYWRAMTGSFPIEFEAIGVSDGWTVCRTYPPVLGENPEGRSLGSGVKFTIPPQPRPVVLVTGRWAWRIRRWLAGR